MNLAANSQTVVETLNVVPVYAGEPTTRRDRERAAVARRRAARRALPLIALTIRGLDRRADRHAVEAIDTSFETATVFDVVAGGRTIELCGADTLYYGSYLPGEAALYLAKRR